MAVQWVNVPFSFYVVDKFTRNGIRMRFRKDNAWTAWNNLFILNGTYTIETFQQEFRRALLVAFPWMATNNIYQKYYCLIQPSTGFLTIYNEEIVAPPEINDTTVDGRRIFELQFDNEELAEMFGAVYNYVYLAGAGHVWKNGNTVTADPVALIQTEIPVKLLGHPRLNLHSDLAKIPEISICRQQGTNTDDILLRFPITNNFGAYLYYQHSAPIIPISRRSIHTASFYLTQGEKRLYADALEREHKYLPLNGEGFQVCIRFLIDNGRMTN
jgi:hypothetical protein